MNVPELLLLEFDEEMPGTRRILERVPEASFAWKPHEKSMTLGRLASHLADLPNRCAMIINTETYVRVPGTPPFAAATTGDLVQHFDTAAESARTALSNLGDDQLPITWTLKMGDRTMATL